MNSIEVFAEIDN